MEPTNPQNRLDEATARRLARLGAMPVDTSQLDRAIRARIPKPPQTVFMRLYSLRAVAASIATIGILSLVLIWTLSGGPVLASPDAMARLHNELISGAHSAMPVTTIAEASAKLSTDLPNVPMDHAMLCCMHAIKDKQVACVLLKSDNDALVTMAVAKATDMRMPNSQVVIRSGAEYHTQKSGDLNMVMTSRGAKWICLISSLPTERLIDIAADVTF